MPRPDTDQSTVNDLLCGEDARRAMVESPPRTDAEWRTFFAELHRRWTAEATPGEGARA